MWNVSHQPHHFLADGWLCFKYKISMKNISMMYVPLSFVDLLNKGETVLHIFQILDSGLSTVYGLKKNQDDDHNSTFKVLPGLSGNELKNRGNFNCIIMSSILIFLKSLTSNHLEIKWQLVTLLCCHIHHNIVQSELHQQPPPSWQKWHLEVKKTQISSFFAYGWRIAHCEMLYIFFILHHQFT